MDDKGNITVLPDGNHGFPCFRGHPGIVGDVATCADAYVDTVAQRGAVPQTEADEPPARGHLHMLGGTDWSGSDPTATSGTPIKERIG